MDSLGNIASESFSLNFIDTLQIETNVLASPTVGASISENLTAFGGIAPYV